MQEDQLRAFAVNWVAEHSAAAEQLLPLLHQVLQRCGEFPPATPAVIADALNLSPAEVAGVLSFYSDFADASSAPCVDVCGAEACQAVGANELYTSIASEPNVHVRKVYCLGNCAAGPSVRIINAIIGRADVGRVLAHLESAPVEPT